MASSAVPTSDVPTISRAELVQALNSGRVILLDVLSRESFAASHLPGAINLPVAEIDRRARDLLPDRDAAIVTYCGSPT